jgi:hypothetical protein
MQNQRPSEWGNRQKLPLLQLGQALMGLLLASCSGICIEDLCRAGFSMGSS